jgi:hypothetical protein
MATACRSCGVAIDFVRTAAGKLNPIEVASGRPHWETCPQAREWRKAPAAEPEPEQLSLLDAPKKPTHPGYPR